MVPVRARGCGEVLTQPRRGTSQVSDVFLSAVRPPPSILVETTSGYGSQANISVGKVVKTDITKQQWTMTAEMRR